MRMLAKQFAIVIAKLKGRDGPSRNFHFKMKFFMDGKTTRHVIFTWNFYQHLLAAMFSKKNNNYHLLHLFCFLRMHRYSHISNMSTTIYRHAGSLLIKQKIIVCNLKNWLYSQIESFTWLQHLLNDGALLNFVFFTSFFEPEENEM